MVKKLKIDAGTSLMESGVWMTPLTKQNGELVWIRFDGSPTSHVLIVCQPGCLDKTEDLVNGVSFCNGVERVDLELTGTPASMRKIIRDYASRLRKAITTGVGVGRTVIVIHRLSGMFSRIRRNDTREELLGDLIFILTEGPALGVHVMMVQDSTDEGVRLLDRLGFDPDVKLGVGSLTPVACEVVFGHVVSSACVRTRSKNIGWGTVRIKVFGDGDESTESMVSCGLFDLKGSLALRE